MNRIYNSNFEIAIRILLILRAIPSKQSSIHRLMILDHLALNTFDIGGPASLHAPVPNRGVQVYSRKELIQSSIELLVSKELLEVKPTPRGINYLISDFGIQYLTYFESKYFVLLSERVDWISGKFGKLSEDELNLFVKENLPKWREEFISEDNLANNL